MKLDDYLVRGDLHLAHASFLSIEVARHGSAQPLPAGQAGHGGRGAIGTFYRSLMKTWIGLYAPPPRRLRPLV